MRIISVQLKNIKSHRDAEFTFAPGINVLSGANGSGKSTIFQAIGYALFGVNAQDFTSRADRFLTIGTKKGEVGVVFEPADGERYRVTRTVGTAGKWLLAKEAGGAFEIEEHANSQETEQRIASLLGLTGGRPLADQFKLVIGPFQNDFLGPFVIRQPTRRQDAFDEILGIDAWRKTFEGTKALASTIAAKIETMQAEVAGKQEQVAVLPAKELELSGLRATAAAKGAELELRQADLEKVAELLSAFDRHKERIEAVGAALRTTEERISSGRDHVANQQLLVEQSKAAAAVVAAASHGKKAYDAADARLKVLHEQEKQKAALEKKLAELEKEQSVIGAAVEIESRELGALRTQIEADSTRLADEEKALGAELVTVGSLRAQADAARDAVARTATSFRELPMHRIDNVLPYLNAALDRMVAIDEQYREKTAALAGSAALAAEAGELPRLKAELEKSQRERSELAGRKSSLQDGCDKICAGDCPFLQEPCKNLQAVGGVELVRSRIADIEADIARLDTDAASLATKVASAQSAAQTLAGLEQVRAELAKLAKERESLEEEFGRRLADIAPTLVLQRLKEWLATSPSPLSLSSTLPASPLPTSPLPISPLPKGEGQGGGAQPAAPECLHSLLPVPPGDRRARLAAWSDEWRAVATDLERQLAEQVTAAEEPIGKLTITAAELATRGKALDGKRRELSAAGEKALMREKAIQAHQQRLDAVQRSIAEEKGAIAAYAGLEDAINSAGAELERYLPERDRYIANETAAGELEKRAETLAKYQQALQKLGEQLKSMRDELDGLQAGYRPDQHESARKDRELLLSAIATLKAELTGIAEGVLRLEGEIAALKSVAREIEHKLAAIGRLNEQGTLVKFLRNQVFRNVSGQLSERFREEISCRADRIYRCISESDEELYWGENYQVVLKDMADGQIRERTDDQLSGGQMMSAVVALRLALLQTIGARIAFFDEPTSNLDAERRENLAKAFRAIDVGQEEVTEHWYDQLFLVSHDVSFTEITDQMIHLD